MKQYVKCFANCIPVKGYKQSFIYDLQRPASSNAIPNDLYEILTNHPAKSVHEIKQIYLNEHDETIDEYFQFLLDEEFAFIFQEIEQDLFPPIDLTWKTPSEISNAIIVLKNADKDHIYTIVSELSELRCEALQFWLTFCPDIKELASIVNSLESLHILSAECVFNIEPPLEHTHYANLQQQFPRLQKLIIGNAVNDYASTDEHIFTTTNRINFMNDCGKISAYYFSLNMHAFTESQAHNTCL
jgi:SPASM domain peptide maturase of grasp-with-spasm system